MSPILFALYISDLGTILENEKGGVNINWKTISGLLFADDLVLIARNQEQLRRLKNLCQDFFETHGLEINVDKSKEMHYRDTEHPPIHLWSQGRQHLGTFKQVQVYRYLGVPMHLRQGINIFHSKRLEIVH